MPVQFAVLASGSKGNAAFVQAYGAGLLIDVGLGPRALAHRLESVGASFGRVAAAVLTHTHGDHVKDAGLIGLARRGVAFYCHEGHRARLAGLDGFRGLEAAGLVRHYEERPFLAPGGLRVEPLAVSHDGGPTFAFRVEGRDERRGRPVAIGYASDLGCWTDALADGFAGVDVLAVEFNHDVELQRRSGRSPVLIARNLSDRGHLSNEQGAGLVEAVLGRSPAGAVRRVALLHLSEDCNRPDLAVAAARGAVARSGSRAVVQAAAQWSASADCRLGPGRRRPAAHFGAEIGFPWEAA